MWGQDAGGFEGAGDARCAAPSVQNGSQQGAQHPAPPHSSSPHRANASTKLSPVRAHCRFSWCSTVYSRFRVESDFRVKGNGGQEVAHHDAHAVRPLPCTCLYRAGPHACPTIASLRVGLRLYSQFRVKGNGGEEVARRADAVVLKVEVCYPPPNGANQTSIGCASCPAVLSIQLGACYLVTLQGQQRSRAG